MSTPKTLTATALGVASLAAPVMALAADDNALRGAPQIRIVDGGRATLHVTTDERLSRTRSGQYRLNVRFADGRRVSGIRFAGRHGDDYRYTARVRSGEPLQAGRKYTVRFTFPGQATVTRLVKAQAA